MQISPQNTSILTFAEARATAESYASRIQGREVESVELLASVGRVLASPITADRDLPPFHRSTRDGFAVRAEDVATVPTELRCVGELKAGAPPLNRTVGRGDCVEIMTGAAMPDGADAVVMVEYTRRNGATITIERSVEAGENVVARGSEARSGEPLAAPGLRVDHAVVALAASTGRARLDVFRRPQIAILATGDELVGIGETPQPHQIRNSNSYSLAAQVIACGGEPRILPVGRDEESRLREVIAEGLTSDMLLISGGVSAGRYDFVEPALAAFGAQPFFTGALIQPGKPVVFAEASRPSSEARVPVFGLPGNPVSTMVCFELFVRPVLDALCGAAGRPLRFVKVQFASDIRTKTGLTRFLPAQLSGREGALEVELTKWRGSGDVVSVARSNCYIVIPPDAQQIARGEYVDVFIPGAQF